MKEKVSEWILKEKELDSLFDPQVADLVSTTFAVRPKRDLAVSISELRDYKPQAVAASIIRQKVVRASSHVLGERDPELASELLQFNTYRERLERLDRFAEARTGILSEVTSRAQTLGIPIEIMKGLVAETWYPEEMPRDVNDVDLMLKNAGDAFSLTRALLANGYSIEMNEVPWIKGTKDGAIYGQINLTSSDQFPRPNYDIHFGLYSVRHCAYLPHASPSEIRMHHTDPTTTVCHFMVNAAGDYVLTLKDVNDLVLALESNDVDFDEVVRRLEAAKIASFLGTAMQFVLKFSSLTQSAELKARRVMELVGRDREAAKHLGVPGKRVMGTVKHAFKVSVDDGLVAASARAVGAWRYYRRPLRLHLSRQHGNSASVALNPWTCTRLVPVEALESLLQPGEHLEVEDANVPPRELTDGVEILDLGGRQLIRAAGCIFVPTVHYDIPRSFVKRAR